MCTNRNNRTQCHKLQTSNESERGTQRTPLMIRNVLSNLPLPHSKSKSSSSSSCLNQTKARVFFFFTVDFNLQYIDDDKKKIFKHLQHYVCMYGINVFDCFMSKYLPKYIWKEMLANLFFPVFRLPFWSPPSPSIETRKKSSNPLCTIYFFLLVVIDDYAKCADDHVRKFVHHWNQRGKNQRLTQTFYIVHHQYTHHRNDQNQKNNIFC